MQRFVDKVAIVTGGSSGIGFACAKLLLSEGAKVCICARNRAKLEKACEQLSRYGEVMYAAADLGSKEQIRAAVDSVKEKYGRIDILINNAGLNADAQFYKMTDEQFEKVIDTNLKGMYYFSKAVIPSMMENRYGKIVSVASVSAFNGNFGQSNYAASKGAVISMTRVMGKELGKYGINVNAVAPGSIMTEMYNAVPEEIKQKKLAGIPLRRYGEPEEAANAICFLASDDASYITSQLLVVDGGFN